MPIMRILISDPSLKINADLNPDPGKTLPVLNFYLQLPGTVPVPYYLIKIKVTFNSFYADTTVLLQILFMTRYVPVPYLSLSFVFPFIFDLFIFAGSNSNPEPKNSSVRML
jgi:hypothetical protein